MKYENELEIDLGRCFRALVKKWWFVAALAVLFGIAGLALTLEKKSDLYTASSTVYGRSAESYSYTQTGVKAMNDYVNVATSMKVCERAALLMGKTTLTGEDVMAATTVSTGQQSSSTVQEDSAIIKITCQYKDPVVAMEMAQAVAEAFVMEMQNILGADAVQVLDKPYSYKQSFDATQYQWKIRIIMFVAGAVIAAVIIFLQQIFDSKASTVRECTLRDELPIIGMIPRFKD